MDKAMGAAMFCFRVGLPNIMRGMYIDPGIE